MSFQRRRAVGITPMETRRDVVLHIATRAEELGYSVFYVAEGWGHDVTTLLAEIAMRTSRIRVASGVLNIWGRSAASIAMLAAGLSNLSDGRFVLGLGAGSRQLAEGLHGVTFRSPVHRLDAVTRDVQALLSGQRLLSPTPAGHAPLRLGVLPQFEVPIHIAALGPKAVRLSGELADAWFPFLLPVSALPGRIQLLTVGAASRASGRTTPLVCPGVPVAISSDAAVADRLASWWITFYLTKMGTLYSSLLRDLGFGGAVAAVQAAHAADGLPSSAQVVAAVQAAHPADGLPSSARVMIDELTLCGNAESAQAKLDRWYGAGADMPVIMLPPNRDVDELDYALEAMRPQ